MIPCRRSLLRAFALLSLLAAATTGAAGEPGLELRGEWQQGAVLFGTVPIGSKVWFNGRPLRISERNEFVFGLDRDAPEQAELKVQLPGQSEPQTQRYAVAKRQYDVQRLEGLPPKMVTPPPEVTARIAADQRLAAAARKHDSALTGFAQNFVWPATGRISGVFGSQRILNGVPKQPHYGVDVAIPTGTDVVAPADGVIVLAESDMYFTGGTLMIDHGHGLMSAFLHLSALKVTLGQTVKQGELIALSGATGRATGPHLDWRMNWFDARVDAQRLVPPMPPKASSR